MCSTPPLTAEGLGAIRALPVMKSIKLDHPMGKCLNKLETSAGLTWEQQRLYTRLSFMQLFCTEKTGLAFPSETLAYLWWLSLCWGRCRRIPSLTPLTWPWCQTTMRGTGARATAAPTRVTVAAGRRGSPAAWCDSGMPQTPGRDTGPKTSTRPSRRCGHSFPRNRWTENSPKSRHCVWRPAISHTWPTCWWSGTGGRMASRVWVPSTRSWRGVEKANSPGLSAHSASATNEKG